MAPETVPRLVCANTPLTLMSIHNASKTAGNVPFVEYPCFIIWNLRIKFQIHWKRQD
jgi:hypothetical protein